jgi:hypothetical protein
VAVVTGELLFVFAVFVVIAVLVGLCVREGGLERNRRLVPLDDLSSLRRHADARSACGRARRMTPLGPASSCDGVQHPAGIGRAARTATDTRVLPCGYQAACPSEPIDWSALGWA